MVGTGTDRAARAAGARGGRAARAFDKVVVVSAPAAVQRERVLARRPGLGGALAGPAGHAAVGGLRIIQLWRLDHLGNRHQALIGHDAPERPLSNRPFADQLVAIAMVVASSLRIRERAREDGAVRATFDFHMSRGRLRVAVISMLLLGATVAGSDRVPRPRAHDVTDDDGPHLDAPERARRPPHADARRAAGQRATRPLGALPPFRPRRPVDGRPGLSPYGCRSLPPASILDTRPLLLRT